VSRTRSQNQVFVVLVIILAIAFWYGGVFIGTQANCQGSEVWVWTPPPHWKCQSPFD
jgi:hypothetical protein